MKRVHVLAAAAVVLAGVLLARETGASSGPRFVDLYTAQTVAGAKTWSGTQTPNGDLDLAGASSTIINSGVNNGGSVPFTDALRSLSTTQMLFESSTTATGGVDIAYRFTPAATFTTAGDTMVLFEDSTGADVFLMNMQGVITLGLSGVRSSISTTSGSDITTAPGPNMYIASAANAANEVGAAWGSNASGLAASAPLTILGGGCIDCDGGASVQFPFAAYAGGGILIDGSIAAPTSVSSGSGTAAVTAGAVTGQAGGACTTAIGTVAGGDGGDWNTTLGAGGAASGASTQNTGGVGGAFAWTSGAGGAATNATTNNGGAGGTVVITAGGGGTGGSAGGGGGGLSLTAGAGASLNGAGGNVTLLGGAGSGSGTVGVVQVGSPAIGSGGLTTGFLAVGGGFEVDGAAQMDGNIRLSGNLDIVGASSTILNSGSNNGGSVPFTDPLRRLGDAAMLFESSRTAGGGAAAPAYQFTPASTYTTGTDGLALFESSAGVDAFALTVGGAATFAGAVAGSNLSGTNTGDASCTAANGLSCPSQVFAVAAAAAGVAGAVTTASQAFSGAKTFQVNDANNATAIRTAALEHLTTGTAATGIGVALGFFFEDAGAASQEGGNIVLTTSDATAGSEDADFLFQLVTAGVVVERAALTSVGNFQIDGDLAIDGGNITSALTCDSTLTVTGAVKFNSTASVTTCTLNGASPSVCTATVTAATICLCANVGATAAIAAQGCAVGLSGTTVTITSANAASNVVNIHCF